MVSTIRGVLFKAFIFAPSFRLPVWILLDALWLGSITVLVLIIIYALLFFSIISFVQLGLPFYSQEFTSSHFVISRLIPKKTLHDILLPIRYHFFRPLAFK